MRGDSADDVPDDIQRMWGQPVGFNGHEGEERLMTAKELAAYLNAPISWVYHHVRDLPAYRVGRGLRFRRREVVSWLAEQAADDRQQINTKRGGRSTSGGRGLE